MNTDEKLASLKYNKDENSHLAADNDVCLRCTDRCCEYICPAEVYKWNEEKGIMNIRYENCLECGACKIACPYQNISWAYPSSAMGVRFKNG